MASTKQFWGAIKSRAQSVKETAVTRIEKFSEKLDKTLEKAQEDLEKKRLKSESNEPLTVEQKVWRPSAENPDGQITTVVVPVISVPVLTFNDNPPAEPTVKTEPIVVRRRNLRSRHSIAPSSLGTLDSGNDSNSEHKLSPREDIRHDAIIRSCLLRLIDDVIIQEDVEKCLEDMIEVISVLDELLEQTQQIEVVVSESIIIEEDNHQVVKESISSSEGSVSDSITDDSALLPPPQPVSSDDETSLKYSSIDEGNEELNDSFDLFATTNPIRTQELVPDASETRAKKLQALLSEVDALIQREDREEYQSTEVEDIFSSIIRSPTVNSSQNRLKFEESLLKNDDEIKNSVEKKFESVPSVTEKATTDTTVIEFVESPTQEVNEITSSTEESIGEEPVVTPSTQEKEQLPEDDEIHSIVEEPHCEDPTRIINTEASIEDKYVEEDQDLVIATTRKESDEELQSTEDFELYESTEKEQAEKEIVPENLSINSTQDEPYVSLDSSIPVTASHHPEENEENVLESTTTPRYSRVHSHPIPTGTIISSILCSSQYILICTSNRKICYIKLDSNLLGDPLDWHMHSDEAENLSVSLSNQTVWRWYNKKLFRAKDALEQPPIGSEWIEIKTEIGKSIISMSVNDQCGWYVRDDGTLWLVRCDDAHQTTINVACPFQLNKVVGYADHVAVVTIDGSILIRAGCSNDRLEGDGWIFVPYESGPFDDLTMLPNQNAICIIDRNHRLLIHQWSNEPTFLEFLFDKNTPMHPNRYLLTANNQLVCLCDGDRRLYLISDTMTAFRWSIEHKNTLFQNLIGVFSDQGYVWTLNSEKLICSSVGHILEKPRQAQYITQATFVPQRSSEDAILWALDESCNIYVRSNTKEQTPWHLLNQVQFELSRRLLHIVCSPSGVWAVDDRGHVHFRHGHASGEEQSDLNYESSLPPAWIPISQGPRKNRSFSHIFCGPKDWMIYATDNKQTVYVRLGITKENRIGTEWQEVEDCSALALAITTQNLFLLTSCGNIEFHECISPEEPMGRRVITLPGRFLSLAVSVDDRHVWALSSKRTLLKLNRLTILFEK